MLEDVLRLIESARESHPVLLYWRIGDRIREEGGEEVAGLARVLEAERGPCFGRRGLLSMIRLREVFPVSEVLDALSPPLSWTHLRLLLALGDPLQREFYTEVCRFERWSTRTLKEMIRRRLYESTSLSRKPAERAKRELQALRDGSRISLDLIFRESYNLDFLVLKDAYGEKDVEAAILRQLERFILELGTGFAFLARQKRITVDGEDYYIDLLFYHRTLRRLVAVELKRGKFKAADKGQMELYLRWLDRHERKPGEGSPLGLILCAERSAEHAELLRLEESGIRVAEYLMELPPRPPFERKLQPAIGCRAAR